MLTLPEFFKASAIERGANVSRRVEMQWFTLDRSESAS
jgi:hypothetical protein